MAEELHTQRRELAALRGDKQGNLSTKLSQKKNKSNSKKVSKNLKGRKEDSSPDTEAETNRSVSEAKLVDLTKESEDLRSLCSVIDKKNQRIITSLLAGGFLRLKVVPAQFGTKNTK